MTFFWEGERKRDLLDRFFFSDLQLGHIFQGHGAAVCSPATVDGSDLRELHHHLERFPTDPITERHDNDCGVYNHRNNSTKRKVYT